MLDRSIRSVDKLAVEFELVLRGEKGKMEFKYYLPVNIMFGCGKVSEIGKETIKYGKKALIVTGKGSTKKSGLLDRVVQFLADEGIDSVVFDQVMQNPLTTTAETGAATAKGNNCDVVVGVGGGSIMDCAKAIAFLAINEGDVNDYIFGRKQSEKALPILLIPTTCGTGSEGNGFAVLTNPETGDKKSLRCNAIIAKVSIVDPECMMTMPKPIPASVGFDALCHCMEAYTSKIAQPFSDALSILAIELLGKHLVKLYHDPSLRESWEAVSIASTIGGMVINTAGVSLSHGMEHPASGLRDIVHGKGLAALTPVIVDASYKGNPEKFAAISKLIGGKDESDCGDAIRKILKELDLTYSLSELGINEEDVEWMTENCLKVSAAGIANNPVLFTAEEISGLYKEALVR